MRGRGGLGSRSEATGGQTRDRPRWVPGLPAVLRALESVDPSGVSS